MPDMRPGQCGIRKQMTKSMTISKRKDKEFSDDSDSNSEDESRRLSDIKKVPYDRTMSNRGGRNSITGGKRDSIGDSDRMIAFNRKKSVFHGSAKQMKLSNGMLEKDELNNTKKKSKKESKAKKNDGSSEDSNSKDSSLSSGEDEDKFIESPTKINGYMDKNKMSSFNSSNQNSNNLVRKNSSLGLKVK